MTVALHEFGHGLGFAAITNGATGARFLEMADAQRAASEINFRKLTWLGEHHGE